MFHDNSYNRFYILVIQIKKGVVYVNGKSTKDPSLIGFAILDAAEENKNKPLGELVFKEVYEIVKWETTKTY